MSSVSSPTFEENAVAPVGARPETVRRLSLAARLNLFWEVIAGGFVELWAHKLRSVLTLTLLMLGVFALVVMTSVLDGVLDKVSTGFAGMSWDGTVVIQPKTAETTEEQKRFAMSPGLRYEDLARLASPHPSVVAFLPRATKRTSVRVAGGTERMWVTGLTPDYALLMNRPIAAGRGLTEDDRRRHSTVAVVGSTLGAKLFGGAEPVGRDVLVDGVPFRIVGLQGPLQIFNEELWLDSNGLMIPLETYMDRMDADHKLTNVAVKLRKKSDLSDVSALVLGRSKQAHHGIEDVEIKDLESEAAKSYARLHGRDARLARRPFQPRGDRPPRGRRRRAVRHAHLVLGPQVRDRPPQVAGRVRSRDLRAVPPRGLRPRGARGERWAP